MNRKNVKLKSIFLILLLSLTAQLSAETIKVGYFNKEFIIFQTENSKPDGLAADIIKDVAENMEWDIEYHFGTFSEVLNLLINGEIDLMIPVGYTLERDKKISYSTESILDSWGSVFTINGSPINSITDVNGKKIGYVKDSLFKEPFLKLLKEFGISCSLVEYNGYKAMFEAVNTGTVAGAIGDRLSFLNYSEENRKISASIEFYPFKLFIAAQKGDPKNLLPSFENYLSSGKSSNISRYQKLLNKWFSHISSTDSTRPYVIYALIFFLVLLSLLLLLSRVPRIQKMFGIKRKIQNSSGRNVIIISLILSFTLWLIDSVIIFLWVNPEGISFRTILYSINDSHELLERLMYVGPIILAGIIIARVFDRLMTEQQKTAASEENLRTTLNSIGDAVVSTDLEGRVVRMNPVAERLTEWKLSEAKGLQLKEIFKIFHAQTEENLEDPVSKVLREGKIISLANHTVLKTKNGKTHHIADSAAPIYSSSGEVSGVVLVFRDVSEEYAMQEQLENLQHYLSNIIDSMPSLLIGLNPEGKITQWNLEAEKLTGRKEHEVLGLKLEKVIPRFSKEMERVKEAIASRQKQSSSRQIRHENNKIYYEDTTIYPLIADGVEGAVLRVDDVTEKVQIEELMIQSEKMLSVGGLAAGMAHEINNPLAGMIQTADVMKNRLMGNIEANEKAAADAGISMQQVRDFMVKRKIPDMIERIRSSGRRASEIVQNMLSFARKSDSVRSSHNLASLLDQTLDLAGNDYDLKKKYDFRLIEIEREYEANLPQVPCEAGKIQQVFLNILRNGAEAMQEYGTEPSKENHKFILRVFSKPDEGLVQTEIQDNGPGIDEETGKRVFEPFFTTKPPDRGTGLGLSVSYFIITENHGGKMFVDSDPGKGARFIIQLPAMKDETDV